MNKKEALDISKGLNTQARNTKSERCPKCDGTMTYHRLKTKDFVCRGCGNIWRK